MLCGAPIVQAVQDAGSALYPDEDLRLRLTMALDKVAAYIREKVLPVLQSVQQHEQQLQRQEEKEGAAQTRKGGGAAEQERGKGEGKGKGKGKAGGAEKVIGDGEGGRNGDAAQATHARRKRARPGSEAVLPPSKRLLNSLARMAAGLRQGDGGNSRSQLAQALPALRSVCVSDIHYSRAIT